MSRGLVSRLFLSSFLVSLVLIWSVNKSAELPNDVCAPTFLDRPSRDQVAVKNTKDPTGFSFPDFNKVSNATTWLVAEVTRGRLGNNMFQYGSAYGVFRQNQASNHDLQFCVADKKRPKFRYLTKYYRGPFAPMCSPRVNVTEAMEETGYGTYTNFSINNKSKPPGSATAIREYLISYRYFDNIKTEMEHMYQLKNPALKRQRDGFIRQQNPRNTTLVGIHIRRTDIARDASYRSPPMGYYQQAMQYFRNKYDNVRFIIASDDKQWCAQQSIFADKNASVVIIPGDSPPPVEMAILSRCQHMILSIGTFGWWAAYLGGGEVIYWNQVFNMDHPKHKGLLKLDDYYPSNWIGID